MQFSFESKKSLISLTPLIDVVFILLLFFMLASNFARQASVTVSSRVASTGNSLSTEKPSRVLVLTENRYQLNDGEVISRHTLKQELLALYGRNNQHKITVYPGVNTNVQDLMLAIEIVSDTGLNQIQLTESSAQ